MSDFYLITGFLGSGKTTFLKNILANFSEHKRIAVIQNEFAPTGVDGKDLKNTGKNFKLIEINNGSVFCVCQLGNFIQQMEKLLEKHAPELVFLEASGLSDPLSIIELLQSEKLINKVGLSGIISIADGENFDKGFDRLPRFKHQLMIADQILINKMDLFQNDTSRIERKISELNPFAKIHKTSYCNVPLDLIFQEKNRKHLAAERFRGKSSAGRPEMKTPVLRSNERIIESQVMAFLDELQQVCIRIKGWIQLSDGKTLAIQTVFDQREVKALNSFQGRAELITFSEKISIKELRQLFKRYTE
jgi:G3E family GTPase